MAPQDIWSRAVLTVGQGRGFVVGHDNRRLVITAGHCLPHMPPAHGALYPSERTYRDLLAPLVAAPSITTECKFWDPIADIVILDEPDSESLADDYNELIKNTIALKIDVLPEHEEARAWVLSLDCRWFACQASRFGRCLWLMNPALPFKGGMSGSPILAEDGSAIGALSVATVEGDDSGPNPVLPLALPVWAVNEIAETADALC